MEVVVTVVMLVLGAYFTGEVLLAKPPDTGASQKAN